MPININYIKNKIQLLSFYFYIIFVGMINSRLLYFFSKNYQSALSYIQEFIPKGANYELVQYKVTQLEYSRAQWIIFPCCILLIILHFIYFQQISTYFILIQQKSIEYLKKAFSLLFEEQCRWLSILVSLLYFSISVYCLFYWGISPDEAWTYNYFIKNEFWFDFLAPFNNHRLYTLMASWSDYVLPFGTLVNIRWIGLLYGFFSILVFNKILYTFKIKPLIRICFVFIFCIGPTFIHETVIARSYIQLIFFTMLYFEILLKYEEIKQMPSILYILVIALFGFLSSVLFILPFVVITVCLLILYIIDSNKKALLFSLKSISLLLIALLLILIVAKLILLKFDINLTIQSNFSIQPIKNLLLENSAYYWGRGEFNFVLIILAVLIYIIVFYRTKKIVFLAGLFILVLPYVIFVFTGVKLGSRFIYYSHFFHILPLGIILNEFASKINLTFFSYVILIVLGFGLKLGGYYKNIINRWDTQLCKDIPNIAKRIIQEEKHTIQVNHFWYTHGLIFYLNEKNYSYTLNCVDKQSIFHKNSTFNPDVIICQKDQNVGLEFAKFKKVYSSSETTMYFEE